MNSSHSDSVEVKQKTSSGGHGEVVVQIKDVNFSYAPGERQILSGLNMEFRRGQVVAVMGGSGCGKTTILRLIGGQFTAQSGQVLFEGHDIGKMNGSDGKWKFDAKKGLTLTLKEETISNLIVFSGHDWENETETILFIGLDKNGCSVWGKKVK